MAVGSKVFFDMMHYEPFKVVVLGDLCSRVTVPVAESAVFWDIVQVRTATLYISHRFVAVICSVYYHVALFRIKN